EGDTQSVMSQPASQGRAKDESDTKGGPDEAEVGRATFRRADVGNVGRRRGKVGPADAGDEAPQKEPGKAGSPGQQKVVEPGAEQGDEDDWATPKAVREIADHRREEELHEGVEPHQPSVDEGGLVDASTGEF